MKSSQSLRRILELNKEVKQFFSKIGIIGLLKNEAIIKTTDYRMEENCTCPMLWIEKKPEEFKPLVTEKLENEYGGEANFSAQIHSLEL